MRLREDWPSARSRQRRREFACLFGAVPLGSLGRALEIGGGDGFMARMLAPYCRDLITTDADAGRIRGAIPGVTRLSCGAERLPFRDGAFDFIFSSSVLEHVRERPEAVAELRRCLAPGGIMLHIMPSRTWKLLQVALYYPDAVAAGIDWALGTIAPNKANGHHERLSPETEAALAWTPRLGRMLSNVLPRPHGEFPGHVSEYLGFGIDAWLRSFQDAGLQVHAVKRLPLYSGYGFGLERARRLGERLGLSAHNAFVVAHLGQKPSAVDWLAAD
jgi:SAM-dependent methyltransferase